MAPTLGNHTGMEIDEATISEAGEAPSRRLAGWHPRDPIWLLCKG
jgi:hypothetical protein